VLFVRLGLSPLSGLSTWLEPVLPSGFDLNLILNIVLVPISDELLFQLPLARSLVASS
jgi:hypothetical protein